MFDCGAPTRYRSVVYGACLFCTKRLGTNEVIETLPVGRRPAFDAAKGRLWGELALLELDWKEAEEIAVIADELTVPGRVQQQLRRLKKTNR